MFGNLFTENQLKVLKLMPRMGGTEIAEELGISRMAAQHRIEEISKKVGLEGYGAGLRTRIVVWAIWVGLIDLEGDASYIDHRRTDSDGASVGGAVHSDSGLAPVAGDEVNEEVCPVKLERCLRFPTKSISRNHDFTWTPNGKDKSGAILKRGVCRLCGFDLGIERFCSRCRIRLPDEESEPFCSECMEEQNSVPMG